MRARRARFVRARFKRARAAVRRGDVCGGVSESTEHRRHKPPHDGMTTGDAAACDDAYVSTVIAKVTRCGASVRERARRMMRATWIGFRRLHPSSTFWY